MRDILLWLWVKKLLGRVRHDLSGCHWEPRFQVYPDTGQGEWGYLRMVCPHCGDVLLNEYLEPLGPGVDITGKRRKPASV